MTISLNKQTSLELIPTPPFNFNASFHKPSHFPTQDVEWQENTCWQTMNLKGKPLGLKLENKGTITKPKIKLTVYYKDKLSKEETQTIKNEVSYWYDLQSDLKPFNKQFKNDKVLGPVLKKWKGMRVSSGYSLYESLMIYVVLQNATVKRSVQMLQNLFEKHGTKVKFDNKELFAFWTPTQLSKASEDELRQLKVGYRAKFIKRISETFANNEINETELKTLNKDDLKEKLLELYGVGPASAWYLVFEVFHHYNAFDHVSPWEQKIYSNLVFNKQLVPTETILKEFKKKYGEWRMLAAHYLFEDLFWKRKHEHIPWLEKEIRL